MIKAKTKILRMRTRRQQLLYRVALIVAFVIPLSVAVRVGADDTTRTTTLPSSTTSTTAPPALRVTVPVWPASGSAAVVIPSLSVAIASPHQPTVPIASLTKMMTTLVILNQLPLATTATGPCLAVNANDVALYHQDVDSDQSSVVIVQGEHLCENTLLRGLLVRSAGDYAELLLRLMHVGPTAFVRTMNQEATTLGLTHTHYVDYTGLSASDRSTARDQTALAVDLMTTEPIVRHDVSLPIVSLPENGELASYTPFIGQDGIIGVKSGWTTPAGGCDVMAVNQRVGTVNVTTYAVVLGQPGGDAINHAGEAALALARSLRSSYMQAKTPTSAPVVWIGTASDVVVSTT
jgi:D-alanyl-D-alanine carboxypeptidase (penicillin-binding protein 5/6)